MSPNVHQGETDDILIDTKDTAFGQPVHAIRFVFLDGGLNIVLVEYNVDDQEKTDTDKIADFVIRDLAHAYGKGTFLMRTPTKIVIQWDAPKGVVLLEVGMSE